MDHADDYDDMSEHDLSDVDSESERVRSTAELQADLVHQIRRGDLPLLNDDQDTAGLFFQRYGDIVAGGENGTLIHVALKDWTSDDFSSFKYLFRILVHKYPALLERRNQDGETTLHYAIKKHISRVVWDLLASVTPEAAAQALACDGPNKGNCLHAITLGKFRSSFTLKIISMCEPSSLMDVDGNGRTPLHHAVRFNKCRNRGNDAVIECLLERGPTAAYVLDEKGHSPLRVHVESRRRSLERDGEEPRKSSRWIETGHTRTLQVIRRRRDDADEEEDGEEVHTESVMDDPDRTSASLKTAERRHQTGKRSSSELTEDDVIESSDRLQNLFKVLLLRTRPVAECQRLIYGDGESETKELCLDLTGTTITTALLNNLSQLVRLESILAYVRLSASCFPSRLGLGRIKDAAPAAHALTVFSWLRTVSVYKVISVTVLEDYETPHSEETVQACLALFDVEHLDWQKKDLCSETILKAAPNIQRLHLHWSGSNPVLRAWSEPEGLAQLRKLTRVILTVFDGNETRSRTMSNIESFIMRLEKSVNKVRPETPIEISWHLYDDKDEKSTYTTSGRRRVSPRASWLHDLLDLGEFVSQTKLARRYALLESGPTRLQSDNIRVCLIDDGIDATDSFAPTKGLVASGKSFSYSSETMTTPALGSSWYVSTNGHGADMAKVIDRCTPSLVQLYVAKVDVVDGKMSYEGLIKSLHWADTLRVDIICIGHRVHSYSSSRSLAMETSYLINSLTQRSCNVICPAVPREPDDSGGSSTHSREIQTHILSIRPSDVPGSLSYKDAYTERSIELAIPSHAATSSCDPALSNTSLDDASMSLALGCALGVLIKAVGRLIPEASKERFERRRLLDLRATLLSLVDQEAGSGPGAEGLIDVGRLAQTIKGWKDHAHGVEDMEHIFDRLTRQLFGEHSD